MNLSRVISKQAAKSGSVLGKIAGQINRTPLLLSKQYLTSGKTRLYFKTENFQYTGSFKLRGAFAKLLTVVLPENVVPEKHDRIKHLGATTVLYSNDAGQAEQHAMELAEQQSLTYLPPYNDPTVIAGQGTIGVEILEQLPCVDNVFVSMGGGGLISGVGSVLKAHSPDIQIIGVSAVNSAALAASMKQGMVVETQHKDTLADGVAGAVEPGSVTLQLAMEVIDQVVHISEPQIVQALQHLAWEEQMIVEGAAALALAAYLSDTELYRDKNNVVVLCGANFNREKISQLITP